MSHRKVGYGHVDKEIMLNPDISRSARFLYSVLSVYADIDRRCYPSVQTLLYVSGMSKDTFYKHMDELVSKNIITKTARKNGNLCCGVIYELQDYHKSAIPEISTVEKPEGLKIRKSDAWVTNNTSIKQYQY